MILEIVHIYFKGHLIEQMGEETSLKLRKNVSRQKRGKEELLSSIICICLKRDMKYIDISMNI